MEFKIRRAHRDQNEKGSRSLEEIRSGQQEGVEQGPEPWWARSEEGVKT